jgi:predicted N-acetyltransferase YhbS
MTQDLDIHPASPEEIASAHRNVFDVWSKGRSLEDHVRHRLNSPTHRRAEWFVGCVDGRVVTSLAAHPIQFRIDGNTVSGIAIGSVYTTKDVRGRGLAPLLIAWVEDFKQRQGTGLSVLYSDIKPEYYVRLGYALCPSWEGFREAVHEAASSSLSYRLRAIDLAEYLPRIKQTYAEYHGALPLSIARNDNYWSMMLEKWSADTFYALEAGDGSWAGYVLVGPREDTWRVIDYAVVDHSDALAEQLYLAIGAAAQAADARRIGGWLPDTKGARRLFEFLPRNAEITMIKPLAWGGTLSPEMIAGAGHFCEFDHV